MVSVLKTPLFRARHMDGTEEMMGMRELLLRAHQLRDISGRTPTGRVALLRHLMAFLTAVYLPATARHRGRLFARGRVEAEELDGYIARCERDGPCFCLDDEARPYMQAPYDEALDGKAERPAATLFADLPTGNNHIFLDHRMPGAFDAGIAEAFEAMLETYMFCPAGLAGPSGINNTPPCYALVCGRNLFETLVLNMISAQELPNIPLGAGEEAWQSREKIVPRQSVTGVSYLRALTWQPRRIRLVIDDDLRVRRVFCQAGLDFRGDGRWMDPNVPYRRIKDGSYASLKPELGRNFWRDAALLAASASHGSRPPVPLENLEDVWEDCGEENVRVEAVGLITNQAACVGWLDETLRMPEILLRDPARAEEFRAWIRFCEDMNLLVVRASEKRFGAQSAVQASQVFLQCMYESIFGALLHRAATEAAEGEARRSRQSDYAKAVFQALDGALRAVVERSGSTVEAMKRQEEARFMLMGSCAKRLREEGYLWKDPAGT